MLRLLALLAGFALVALILFARRSAPDALALEVHAAEPDVPETEQPLESLDDETDLRHESRPDAPPRVFGRLHLESEAVLSLGGRVRVLFEDHHASPFSAADAHARITSDDERLHARQA